MSKVLYSILGMICIIDLCSAAHIAFYTGESTSKEAPATKKITLGFHINDNTLELFDSVFYWGVDSSYWQWDNHYGDDITGGAITPTLTLYDNAFGFPSYYRLGIGVTYVDTVKWHNRDLGDNWLFENKFEYGIKLSPQQALSLSINHYSNAGLHKFNDGTNVIYLGYSFNW